MIQRIKDTIIGTALVVVALSTIPFTFALLVWMVGA